MENFQRETVRETMSHPARTVAPEMTVGDLLRLFASNDFDAYPVVRDGKLVGMVSRADCIGLFAESPGTFDETVGTTVEEIMSWQVVSVEPDATLEQVVELMGALDFDSFPVVDRANDVKGIIAREDIVRALARSTWDSSLPLPLAPAGYAIA